MIVITFKFLPRVLVQFYHYRKVRKQLKLAIYRIIMLPGAASKSQQTQEVIALRGLILFASLFIFAPCPRTCEMMPAHTSPGQMLPHWQDVALWCMIDTTKMFRARMLLIGAITDPLAPVLEFWQKWLITVVF